MQPASIHVGIDIIEVQRIEDAVSRWKDAFLKRLYTEEELKYCQGLYPSLAAHFATKESVMKALNTGFAAIGWRDIEIMHGENGAPLIRLSGNARRLAEEKGIIEFSISMAHCKEYAIALAVGYAA